MPLKFNKKKEWNTNETEWKGTNKIVLNWKENQIYNIKLCKALRTNGSSCM